MPEGIGDDPSVPVLNISIPEGSSIIDKPWNLIAHNKKILKGWEVLCQDIPENAIRCYNWLREDPMRRIPGRCYELKHKHYAGAWCYEIGSGQRVYYKPRINQRDVLIYYAGRHPKKVPYPPP
jgi:hypothetical protein